MAKSRYQVSYVFRGQDRFGIVSSAKPKVKGNLVIEDAVLPWAAEVPDDANVKDIPLTKDFPTYYRDTGKITKGGSPYDHFVNAAFVAATAASEAAGLASRSARCSPSAWRMARPTTSSRKVTKTKATIEWRGFSGDRYMDHVFGWGKTVSITDAASTSDGRMPGTATRRERPTKTGKRFWPRSRSTRSSTTTTLSTTTSATKGWNGRRREGYKPVGLVGDVADV